MEYDYFTLLDNEIEYQSVVNGLLVTPYSSGICVDFGDGICLNCDGIENTRITLLDRILKYENGVFYVGVAV